MARLPVPDKVGRAVVATEDSRFYSHPGIDPLSIVREARSLVTGNQDPGGATLDQQLAKLLFAPGGSAARKVEQAELALKLDAAYAKPTLLRFYLSAVYFGHGYYGLPAAARGYFGRSPRTLTWAQASMLAGLVQAPSAYDPYVHYALAKSRQAHVLDRLVATGVLTRAAARAAYRAPLGLR
jgi:penicillin-binding protein 1A